MREVLEFYINGEWVDPEGTATFEAINPATEEVSGRIALGSETDVDRAVRAAHNAFDAFGQTTREERIALLERVAEQLQRRADDLAEAVTLEMGAPQWVAQQQQAPLPRNHVLNVIEGLRHFEFDRPRGTTLVRLVPVGVCGMITPWNWPLGTLFSKVAPALATGNTIVVKPSEYSAFSAKIVAELMHDAGVPAGVFNMVFGDGPTVGSALSRHPLVACISITGSVRAGAAVARDAAETIKRVHQELGGKSPNIILRSADLAKAVDEGVRSLMNNTGQSCSAPSRMIAPNAVMDQVKAIAAATVEQLQPGVPESNAFTGPVVNKNQFDRIQELIRKGIAEGATVVAGGPGKPDGLANGYYVKPTVFADATPDMMIVREEIFGPVLVIQGYDTVEEAIQLALDTEYGLAAFVQGGDDLEEVRAVADRMQAGQVCINTVRHDFNAPFGGFRHSGNGREWGGDYGFDGFLEPKSLVGWKPTERAS